MESKRWAGLCLAVLGVLLAASTAKGVTDLTVAGPYPFIRLAGEPQPQTRHFSLDNIGVAYVLEFTTGAGGTPPVTSLVAYLNGERILKSDDLHHEAERWKEHRKAKSGKGADSLAPQGDSSEKPDKQAKHPSGGAGRDRDPDDDSKDEHERGPPVTVRIPVSLARDNTLTVEVRGKPGARVDVGVKRADNRLPVANAGMDQSGPVGTAVRLDGSGSSDADGDALNYRWSLLEQPQGSAASLTDAASVTPEFTPDMPGDYRLQLTVSDRFDSGPADEVIVSTLNSAPVANAGPDQSGWVGGVIQLDGQSSRDVDGDPLSYFWTLAVKPEGSQAVLSATDSPAPTLTLDKPGAYSAELIVHDGKLASPPDTVVINTLNSRPAADAGSDIDLLTGQTASLDGSASHDADGDPLSYSWSLTSVPEGSQAALSGVLNPRASFIPDVVGLYVAQLIVHDGQAASDPDTVKIVAQAPPPPPNRPPYLSSAPVVTATAGQPYQYALQAGDADGDPLAYSLVQAPAGMAVDGAGLVTWTPQAAGSESVTARISDNRGGSVDQSYAIEVAQAPGTGLPPDPARVATPLDPTVATPLWEANQFLYSGANPVQTGADPAQFDAKRFAVLRGQVFGRDEAPIAGVTVAIKDHPEFGQTLTRSDGWFDLAVNGGGLLTLEYKKEGLLPVQRQVNAPWQDYAFAKTVVMIPLDSQVTAIDLANATQPIQVAQSSLVTDADGTRQATMFFPAGTTAIMHLPGGGTQPLTTLHVRATEYTVGASGPSAMPGPLPPTSGYTYAVELSVDEVLANGVKVNGKDVEFSQAIPVYVDNFLNFPVGEAVPAGYYDRDKAAWIPYENGRVIKLLGVISGLAQLDITGAGAAATTGELAALGISNAELAQLAAQYAPGKTLWRVALRHFSTWDFNQPWGFPWDRIFPPLKPSPINSPICPTIQKRCTILNETRVLGQDVPITGTPFSLHYRSDNASGSLEKRSLDIPVTETSIPASLKSVVVEIDIAGQQHAVRFDRPQPNLRHRFVWDGRDGYGRALSSSVARVVIYYNYDGVYYANDLEKTATFALPPKKDAQGKYKVIGRRPPPPSSSSSGGSSVSVVIKDKFETMFAAQSEWTSVLGDAKPYLNSVGLGGWTLNAQHFYQTVGSTFRQGNGGTRRAETVSHIIDTVAGTGVGGYSGDGGPASLAKLASPRDVKVAPDGSLYVSEEGRHTVRKIDPRGVITTLAGVAGQSGFSGDGGPATAAKLNSPQSIALGTDGSVYLADMQNQRIRRVAPNGIISTVAGNGVVGRNGDGDGGLATSASLYQPEGIAVAADGTVYLAERSSGRIRRVGADGRIETVARISYPVRLDMSSGGLFVAALDNKIYRIGGDAVTTVVAGAGDAGTPGYSGDGGPATQALLSSPFGIASFGDGFLYIADTGNHVIRKVDQQPGGFISTFAGKGQSGYGGDGGFAAQAKLWMPMGGGMGPDGSFYIADLLNQRIRRVSSALPGFSLNDISIPSADGAELHVFNYAGRHLKTLDAHSGQPIYTFGYDKAGQLITLTSRDGDITRLERDASGKPTAIVAPDGQRTVLTLDANGYLATLTEPAGGVHAMQYDAGGLMTAYANPRGHGETYQYDAAGAFVKNLEANGGGTTLARSERPNGYTVSATSGEGLLSRYTTDTPLIGGLERLITEPDGTQTKITEKPTGETVTTSPDGTVTTTLQAPDPRFGIMAGYAQTRSVKTPSGLTFTASATRSAPLADPANLFSYTALTHTTTLNGNLFKEEYVPGTSTWKTTSAMGRTVTLQVDGNNRPILGQTPGIHPVAYAYDERGRLTKTTVGTAPNARATSYAYDDKGQLASVTDAANRPVQYQYDANGRITRQILPDAREILYQYDANGNLTALSPPGRPQHQFEFDVMDQVQSYLPPGVPGILDRVTHYAYDKDKRPTTITRPDGQQVQYHYGPVTGHLDSLQTPTGSLAYAYDSAGRLQTITSPQGGQLAYVYDGSLPTVEAWSGEVGGMVNTGYDNFFRPKSQTIDNAHAINYAYDADGLLTLAGNLSLTRDAQNGLLTQTNLGQVKTAQSYNGFGEVSGYQAITGTTSLAQWTYQRDNLGRITQKQETLNGQTDSYDYAYDTAGRLVEVKKNGQPQSNYGYDQNGNRTQLNGQTVATYDDQDRLVQYAGNTYSYTDNGELKTKTTASGITTYTYDVMGNLTHVTLPDGTAIDYLVDGLDRRIGKKVNGSLAQGLLYQDQLKPIAELDGVGNVVSRFVYGDKNNVPAYLIKGGNTYRIVSDHLGSPRLVINTADGSIVQQIDYDAWGYILSDTNPGFQPFGFAGGLYDRHTKLTRFGARDYDAETGRWTVKDPIGFEGGDSDLYEYTGNDPINFIDPMGLYEGSFSVGYGGTFAIGMGDGFGVSVGVSVGRTDSGMYYVQGQVTRYTKIYGAYAGYGRQYGGGLSMCPLKKGFSYSDKLQKVIGGGFGLRKGADISVASDSNSISGQGGMSRVGEAFGAYGAEGYAASVGYVLIKC